MRWMGAVVWLLWCSEVSSLLQLPVSALRRIHKHSMPHISLSKPTPLPRHDWKIHAHSGDTAEEEKEAHKQVEIAEHIIAEKNISRIDWKDTNAWKKLTLDEAMQWCTYDSHAED